MIVRIFIKRRGPCTIEVTSACMIRAYKLDPTIEWLLNSPEPMKKEYRRLLTYWGVAT